MPGTSAHDPGHGSGQDGELLDRFTALAGPGSRGVGEELLARWGEPHRRYHTVAHLRAVLARLDELAGCAADETAVGLAAWFHDAVYDPSAPDNEERSARLAERLLPPGPRRDEVARLVRLTTTHDPADDDANGAALCDADLAVLAAPPARYAAYAAEIRQEYGFVSDEDFRTGRAAVLRRLLALPHLFRTPHGRAHWEATARFNLNGELLLLTAGPPYARGFPAPVSALVRRASIASMRNCGSVRRGPKISSSCRIR
ncbi:HD domain-containing protein [Streptomyces specialis]|uniref:HD domain-containing protein n=1 Tax=Streptomyces specialis TaxID=498367 RepID=UPI001F1EB6CA|nr:metal-dependent phosphohydrolase [Streptomyces specialis]